MPVATRMRIGGFAPNKLTGLALWLAANRITGLTDGTAVATWPDASGNGRDATQATSGNRPIFKTAIFNGQPVVRFTAASSHWMATDSFSATIAQPNTIVLVVKFASLPTTMVVYDGGAGSRQILYKNNAGFELFADSLVNAGTPDTNSHVLTVEMGATDTIRVDGTQVLSGNAGTRGLGALRLGVWTDAGANYLDGDLAEVVAYDRALATAERQQLERHLGVKYGITVA